MAEELCGLVVQFAADLDRVAWPYHFEHFLEISFRHPNTSVRSRFADRTWYIRSVDPVAFLAKSDPARAERILWACFDHSTAVVVSRFHYAVHDVELAFRARGNLRAHCNGVGLQHPAFFHQNQYAISDAHHDLPRNPHG